MGQNNLAHDTNSWCFPCNNAHTPRNCLRGNLQQKIAEQRSLDVTSDESVYVSPSMDNASLIAQMQGMSMQQEIKIAPDHALFSWIEDKDAVLTNGATTSKEGVPFMQSDYNLCSKRRFTRENMNTSRREPADKAPEQPAVVPTYPRKEFVPYKPREPKSSMPSILDMVELKKAPTNVSLWDLLSIPEQKNRLKEAMSDVGRSANENATKAIQINEGESQPSTEKLCSPTVLTNETMPPKSQMEAKPKLNPFYLTVIVGDKLLHNSMIDSGASTTIMPRHIAEVLNIKYEPLNRGVIQLDRNKV